MKKLLFLPIAVAALAPTFLPAQGQDAKAAYDRSESLNGRVQGLVYNLVETPTFIAGTPRLWYRKSVKGGNEFVLVDATARTKGPAFDHAKLAASLSTAASGQVLSDHAAIYDVRVRRQPAGDPVHDRRRWRRGGRGGGGAAAAVKAARPTPRRRGNGAARSATTRARGAPPQRLARPVRDVKAVAVRGVEPVREGRAPRARLARRRCAYHPTSAGRR